MKKPLAILFALGISAGIKAYAQNSVEKKNNNYKGEVIQQDTSSLEYHITSAVQAADSAIIKSIMALDRGVKYESFVRHFDSHFDKGLSGIDKLVSNDSVYVKTEVGTQGGTYPTQVFIRASVYSAKTEDVLIIREYKIESHLIQDVVTERKKALDKKTYDNLVGKGVFRKYHLLKVHF